MKAIVYHNYGSPDILELEEVEKPIVKDDQVQIKVHAASVNQHDWHFLAGTPLMARLMAGLLKPRNKVYARPVQTDAGGTLCCQATAAEFAYSQNDEYLL